MQNKGTGKVTVGHPVDVATGTLFHDFEDFTLPGHAPLVFGRRYSTALIGRTVGMFGAGWSSPFEMRLRRDLDGYHLIAEDGETEITFDDYDGALEAGGVLRNLGAFHDLRREQNNLIATRWNPDSEEVVRYIFTQGRDGEWWPLQSRQTVDGQGVDLHYDLAGRIVNLTQCREGRGYRLAYDAANRVTEVYLTVPAPDQQERLDPHKRHERLIVSYRYDEAGRLAAMIDALGNRCGYEYDAAGRMTREVNIGGMEFRFRYDGQGRCVETTGPDGFDRNLLEINELARLTRVTDPLGHVTAYQWNEAGQVEREISPLGNIKVTAYDDHGRIIAQTSPTGATTAYEYDERGDRVKITAPTGGVTQHEFNENHQAIGITDPAGHKWSWSFDGAGRAVSWSDPLGNTWNYSHNRRGDLVSIKDPLSYERRFAWDGLGNLTSATDWLGHRTAYEYDEEGRVKAVIDPLGYRTEAENDALGRIRLLRHPDGAVRRFTWNVYDQIVEYTDEVGATTRWRYTPCGLLRKVIRPHSGQIKFKYTNVPGQLVTVTNENGVEHFYEYDADGRMIKETDFGGRITRYAYDKDGQVSEITNNANQRTELKRNAAGAVLTVNCDDGSRITYEYDARGYLIKADNGDCPVAREYDAAGRLILEQQGEHIITSKYDAAGNRITRRSSLDRETTFAWDGNGQISSIRTGRFDPIHFEYDARQCETARYIPGGVRINQAFDNRGRNVEQWTGSNTRPGRVSVGVNTAQGVHRRYGYDAASNLTEMQDARWGKTRYTYDPAGRVTSAQHQSFAERFVYDPADNFTKIERLVGLALEVGAMPGAETPNWQYGKGNELVKRDGVSYEYDALGQLVRKTDEKGETIYKWNRFGQLAKVNLPDAAEWEYKYDPFARRVEKRGPGQGIGFVWDGDVVLHEVHGKVGHSAAVIDWEFDPYGFAPIAKVEGVGQYLCVNDIAGTPRELTSRDGDIAWTARLSTFGEVQTERAGRVNCPVRFQGQWYDEESGLHYNRFRYYDPVTNRYTLPDPIGLFDHENINPYGYTINPFSFVDPFGLTKKCPPNPWGRRGSPAHQARVAQAEQRLSAQGWRTVSGGSLPERAVSVSGGRRRYPDLVMERNGQQIAIQVGRVTGGGMPVPRERAARSDLRGTGQFSHVFFLRY